MYMRIPLLFIAVIVASCSTAKVAAQENVGKEAIPMKVKGLNGLMINQKISFGPYSSSTVKRGWDFNASVQYTRLRINPEEAILKVFNIDTDKRKLTQKGRFQFTLQDSSLMTEVFATEDFREEQLVYKSNNPFLGTASQTKAYQYAFTVAILPVSLQDNAPWSLVLINSYDISKDTARRLLDQPYVEEEGYATNGKDNIAIRPIRASQVSTKQGKQKKIWGNILAGYELQWNGSPAANIDLLTNSITIKEQLAPQERLLLASVASSILLKRMQDVQQDKDALSD